MFPYKSLFEICRLLSYWPTNLIFVLLFVICRPLIRTLPRKLRRKIYNHLYYNDAIDNTCTDTLITETFPRTRKRARKEKPLKKSCQNFVEHACAKVINLTLERGWTPNSSVAVLIRRAPFWPADMHTVRARAAKTGYTTSLTSVTSPNSRTTYRAYSTGF